jgi:hypothetical protein
VIDADVEFSETLEKSVAVSMVFLLIVKEEFVTYLSGISRILFV